MIRLLQAVFFPQKNFGNSPKVKVNRHLNKWSFLKFKLSSNQLCKNWLGTLFTDSVLSGGGLSSGIGLNSIKLESSAYYCTSYTPPCSDKSLISSNYGSLSLARSNSPSSVAVSLSDNSVIRVKRMRRMSSENDEDLRGDKVSDLYYSQSPLSQATAWSQADLDQTSIGELVATLEPLSAAWYTLHIIM